MSGRRAAAVVARVAIGLAVRLLPSAHRGRYRTEFRAELHGLRPAHQLRHAAGLLATGLALRAALSATPSRAGEEAMTPPQDEAPFWRCRVLRWHDWALRSTEDGARFERCRRCGVDRGPVSVLPTTTPPWPGGR